MAQPSIPACLLSTLAAVKFQEIQKLPKVALNKLLAYPGFLSRTAKGLQLAVWDCSINFTLFPIGSMASLNTKCLFSLILGKVRYGTNCSGSRSPPQGPTQGLITERAFSDT